LSAVGQPRVYPVDRLNSSRAPRFSLETSHRSAKEMKMFRAIQSMLIAISMIGCAGALAHALTQRSTWRIEGSLYALFLCWSFSLWRRMKSKEEKNHCAFLWLESFAYSGIVLYPVIIENEAHIPNLTDYQVHIIGSFILISFLGISLSALRIRNEL